MFGQMMQMPLLISSLICHADRYHGDTQIVSRLTEGGIHRYAYTDAHRRARQLARALGSLGVRPGQRIGTLAWNNHRHFEIYYAVCRSPTAPRMSSSPAANGSVPSSWRTSPPNIPPSPRQR
jgi:3-(methylthio)propionyl---CoA ligase